MSDILNLASQSVYPKLVSWQVTNFMSIGSAKAEFDDSGILNFKGYNDSGKSAMLRALDVLFFNIRPNAQVNFIKNGTDYFRIIAQFEDGVMILRDKYINGQSLYEMYKNGELVYSTKVNGVLSKVSSVPEPIAAYLGLLTYDGMAVNSRSCFEKQLLVQTTGGENYKLLNSVLKSEELATAGTLLNNDKNKLASDIADADRMLKAYKEMRREYGELTGGMIDALVKLDEDIDSLTQRKNIVCTARGLYNKGNEVKVYDELPYLDSEGKVNSLCSIADMKSEIDSISIGIEVPSISTDKHELLQSLKLVKDEIDSINISPLVNNISSDRWADICEIYNVFSELERTQVAPEIQSLSCERLNLVSNLLWSLASINTMDTSIRDIDIELSSIHEEISSITGGHTGFVTCPSCGEVFAVD